MLTRDLKKSSDALTVQGKLIINISTNVTQPRQGSTASSANRPSLLTPQSSTTGLATPVVDRPPPSVSGAPGAPAGTASLTLPHRPASMANTSSVANTV